MFSENFRKIRKELDISAQKMADTMGVSRGAIVQYETGKRKPSYEFMEALYKFYNVNLNWLVSSNGEMFMQAKETSDSIDEEKIFAAIDKYMKNNGLIT